MKNLSEPTIKLLTKYGIDHTELFDKETIPVNNRFSGEAAYISTEAASLYNTIITLNDEADIGTKINIPEFDRLRYIFLKLFPTEYYILLD